MLTGNSNGHQEIPSLFLVNQLNLPPKKEKAFASQHEAMRQVSDPVCLIKKKRRRLQPSDRIELRAFRLWPPSIGAPSNIKRKERSQKP